MALLEIDDLHVAFETRRGTLRAVDGVSFSVEAGETLAIVGESGSGKSVSVMSILGLLRRSHVHSRGAIRFKGMDLMTLPEAGMARVRGNQISMIFQEPMTALNPVLSVGWQIAESLRLHQRKSARESRALAIELLALVGIPSPRQRANEYVHQLSGGMRQRVMIAMALACNPEILLADEPTTALDVTVQAQVLDLLRGLQAKASSALVLITHDFGVVAEMAQRVIIMYAGRKVEEGSTRQILSAPAHPYTAGLLAALPRLGSSVHSDTRDRLSEIPGIVPDLTRPILGCAFATRCGRATSLCTASAPGFGAVAPGHLAACHHPIERTIQ